MGRQQYAGQIDAGNHHPTGTLTIEAGETKLTPAVKGTPGPQPGAIDYLHLSHSGTPTTTPLTNTSHHTTDQHKNNVGKIANSANNFKKTHTPNTRQSDLHIKNTVRSMSKNTTNGHLIKNTDDGVPNGNLWGSNKGDNTPNTRRKQGKGRKQNTLKLMAINVRGIKSKTMSLSAALNTNGTHICCISESLLTQNEKIHIDGYKIITKSRRCEGGGVMILIRNDIIPHVEIPDETITDTHLEIIWIKTKAYPPIYIGALWQTRKLQAGRNK